MQGSSVSCTFADHRKRPEKEKVTRDGLFSKEKECGFHEQLEAVKVHIPLHTYRQNAIYFIHIIL